MEITSLFECKAEKPINEKDKNTDNHDHCERVNFTPLSEDPTSRNHGYLSKIYR